MADRRFVVVTKDFSGLGWADRLDQEGNEVHVAVRYEEEEKPEHRKAMKEVGKGWLDVLDLDKAIDTFGDDKDVYWIFAENNFPDEAEALIKDGCKVFPPSMALGEQMEHDRDLGVDIAKQSGLTPPKTFDFTDREEALQFLDSHPDHAYVMKINDNKFNFQTFVPNAREDEDANRQLSTFLEHMKEEPGDFILQERIPIEKGLEVNAELWLYKGEPIAATVGLELKRKNTYDVGEMTGCAGDFMFFVDIDTPLIQQTVAKMLPFYKQHSYTGFADVNVILTKDNEPHFLEVCNRMGYNAHVSMLIGLGLDPVGDILADYTDGKVEDMDQRFSRDICCSLTLFMDHPRLGLPITVKPEYADRYYPFDGFKEDGDLLMTGYSDELGIFVGRAKTLEAAWDKVSTEIAQDEAVIAPDIYYRWDLAETNYYNAPVLRYRELKKRGLL